MALLLSPTVSFLASPSPPRSRALFTAAASGSDPTPRLLQCKKLASLQSPLKITANHYSLPEKRPVIVHAAADASGEPDAEQPEEPKPAVKIEEMSLESKQQMILEQRARMKLAKKLRKRLVRKRRLRKKGRWPPSKMKKLKNV